MPGMSKIEQVRVDGKLAQVATSVQAAKIPRRRHVHTRRTMDLSCNDIPHVTTRTIDRFGPHQVQLTLPNATHCVRIFAQTVRNRLAYNLLLSVPIPFNSLK